mgnify:CR=1 FL=1
MSFPYIVGRDSITVMVDGVTHTVNSDHMNYNALRDAIREARWDDVPELVTPARAIRTATVDAADLTAGLDLYRAHDALGAFDSVLASVAMRRDGMQGLVSADRAFATVGGLTHYDPASAGFLAALGIG